LNPLNPLLKEFKELKGWWGKGFELIFDLTPSLNLFQTLILQGFMSRSSRGSRGSIYP
jgi:hypothetical protein